MDAIYYISGILMLLTLIGLVIATIFFLLKPHHLQKSKYINKPVSRKAIVIVALVSIFVAMFGYGSVMAATEPASVKEARAAEEAVKLKAQEAADIQRKLEEAKKPIVKTETKTEAIPFESANQNDNTLGQGETRVASEGVNGERTITYEVTYVQNIETARKEIKNEITTQPITKVTQVGTYVAPVYAPAPPQSSVRIGAVCGDGSHSSATGSGACSHHGGVAYWLYG